MINFNIILINYRQTLLPPSLTEIAEVPISRYVVPSAPNASVHTLLEFQIRLMSLPIAGNHLAIHQPIILPIAEDFVSTNPSLIVPQSLYRIKAFSGLFLKRNLI